MDRRTGIAIAGGISLVVVAGAFALAANVGWLSAGSNARHAATVSPTPQTRVVTVEVTESPKPSDAVEARSADHVEVVTVPLPAKSSEPAVQTASPDDRSGDAVEVEHESGEGGDD